MPGFLSLEKTDSSILSYQLPVALHLGVGPCEVVPIYAGMSTGSITVQVSLLRFCGCRFLVVYRRRYLRAVAPELRCSGCAVDVSFGASATWSVVVCILHFD